jgi:hypothetical protein
MAAGPDAQQTLARTSRALDADQLKSLQYSATGYSYALGQAGAVNLPWPRFNDISHTRLVSFDPWATRLERVRTQGELPPRGGGGQPVIGEQKQTQSVAPGTPAAATVADELAVLLPQAFVKAAAQAGNLSAASETRDGKKYVVLSYTALNKATTRGWVNDRHLIDRVETTIANGVLGDVKVETTFAGYRDFNGVPFPSRIEQKQAGYPVLELDVTSVETNVPADIQAAAPPAPPPALASEQLAPGVYLVSGGYAAVVIPTAAASSRSTICAILPITTGRSWLTCRRRGFSCRRTRSIRRRPGSRRCRRRSAPIHRACWPISNGSRSTSIASCRYTCRPTIGKSRCRSCGSRQARLSSRSHLERSLGSAEGGVVT